MTDQSPNQIYRHEFLTRILADEPSSVLDVGCGDGVLLAQLGRHGIRAVGVDLDEALAKAREAGLDVQAGSADRLPFPDASFDVVTFAYVTHHLADMAAALAEAARVARRAVHVLDAWYDVTLPSQRIAHAFDLWGKEIDRANGMVHEPCPLSDALLPPLAAGGYSVETRYALRLRDLGIEVMQAQAAERLASSGCDAAARTRYEALLADAARAGFSDDGAISVRAWR